MPSTTARDALWDLRGTTNITGINADNTGIVTVSLTPGVYLLHSRIVSEVRSSGLPVEVAISPAAGAFPTLGMLCVSDFNPWDEMTTLVKVGPSDTGLIWILRSAMVAGDSIWFHHRTKLVAR